MGDIELQDFSERLKELRHRLNFTQKEFADKIGVTAAALSSYENNIKNPSIAVAKRIAESFNVSIDWLCGLEKEKSDFVINTYSDIIRMLFEISKYVNLIPLIDEDKPENNCDAMLCFTEFQLDCFLVEWAQAYTVRYNSQIKGDITKTMYDSWANSKIEEFKKYKVKKKKD